jgi:pimeloyl-ACP methyl ester carboxylesterase
MTNLILALALTLTLASCTPRSISTRLGSATAQPKLAASTLSSTGVPAVVEADGKSFVIRCFGEGTPSIVLENGYGVNWTEWKEVIAGIQDQTRICAYDRATPAITSLEAADDLHAMLTNAGLAQPYILVGHSLGGFTVILYASRHPEELAGAVLVDSSHPDQDARALAVLPAASATENQALTDLRAWLESMNLGDFDWKASTDQVRAVTTLGAIPLAVVEASPDNISGFGPIGSDELKKQLSAVKHALQIDHDLLSTNSVHFTSTHSGHLVPQEDPVLVIEAILSLLANASGG